MKLPVYTPRIKYLTSCHCGNLSAPGFAPQCSQNCWKEKNTIVGICDLNIAYKNLVIKVEKYCKHHQVRKVIAHRLDEILKVIRFRAETELDLRHSFYLWMIGDDRRSITKILSFFYWWDGSLDYIAKHLDRINTENYVAHP